MATVAEKPKVQMLVSVVFNEGFYTAVCEDLGIVTEAKTLEALRDQVWDLVPDMLSLNQPQLDPARVRLGFDLPPIARAA
jgi:hypothetical protein